MSKAKFVDVDAIYELFEDDFHSFTDFIQINLHEYNKQLVALLFRANKPSLLYVYPALIKLFDMKLAFVVLDESTQLKEWIQNALDQCAVLITDDAHNCQLLSPHQPKSANVFSSNNGLGRVYVLERCDGCSWVRTSQSSDTQLWLKPHALRDDDTVYVVQTSGTSSTTTRRSVFVSRACFSSNLDDFNRIFNLTASDSILATSPVTFDPFYLDVFMAHTKRAELIIPSVSMKSKGTLIFQKLPISFAQMTSTFWLNLNKTCLRSLKYLVLGGEAFPSTLEVPSNCLVFQAYGLTEMSIWQSLVPVDKTTPRCDGIPAIAGPNLNLLTHTDVAVCLKDLDEDYGENVGEVVVSSSTRLCTVMPESQQCCLLLRDTVNEQCYRVRTQDLAKVDEKGNIFFAGRKNGHIKIGGKRTSISELEHVWNKVLPSGNSRCVVAASFDDRTIAFVSKAISLSSFRELINGSNLPVHLRPTLVIGLEVIPTTPNLKVDSRRLRQVYLEHLGDTERLESLELLWTRFTGLKPNSSSQFMLEGGDSLKAVHMTKMIEELYHVEDNVVLETLLARSYGSLCSLMKEAKRRAKRCASNAEQSLKASDKTKRAKVDGRSERTTELSATVLRTVFRVDLEKCIDATPLLFQFRCNGKGTNEENEEGIPCCVIGSHSGLVVCVDVQSGSVRWRRRLPNRVEASANTNVDGSFVIVGCYDHHVYALAASTGATLWTYCTDDIVKSKALITSSHVIFGSYDHFVHSLHVETGKLSYKLSLDSSIKADVVMCDEDSGVVADLRGNVVTFNVVRGDVKWKNKVKGPVFGTPAITTDLVILPCATGHVTALSLKKGHEVWSYRTRESSGVFTSIKQCGSLLIFGLQNGQLSALNNDGEIVWTINHSDRVVATPCLLHRNCNDQELLVISVSVDGQLLEIKADQGVIKRRMRLERSDEGAAQVFSSPIVFKDRLLIGSRDNQLHCCSLSSK